MKEDRRAAEEAEQHALHVSETEYDGQRYVSWPWRGSLTASLVYESAIMPDAGHWQITEMQTDRVVATVRDLRVRTGNCALCGLPRRRLWRCLSVPV